MNRATLLKVVIVATAAGIIFSGFSTLDFAEHLDRQEHSVHCSFIPGLNAQDASGSSGCQVAMMSPYSSILRKSVWGGIPIALASMSVFAFLLFLASHALMTLRTGGASLGLLVLATLVPVGASVVMGTISVVTLGTVCKLCVAIYVASALSFIGALLAWKGGRTRNKFAAMAAEDSFGDSSGDPEAGDEDDTLDPDSDPGWPRPASRPLSLALVAAMGVIFVAVPIGAWMSAVPEVDTLIGDCGFLDYPKDTYGVMVGFDEGSKPASAVEILDPLCPACRAFEDRFLAAGLDEQVSRKLLLFPLDNSCNWMVDSAIHPGACTVSEAILCAGDGGAEVLNWAFDEQEAIRAASAEDPKAARNMVVERFPKLRSCVGSAVARSKLNKSLRWAVRNRLPLLTPQFYLEGVKLCDEDVDLGLDYAISTLVGMHESGALAKLIRPPRRAPATVQHAAPSVPAPLAAATPTDITDNEEESDGAAQPAATPEIGHGNAEAPELDDPDAPDVPENAVPPANAALEGQPGTTAESEPTVPPVSPALEEVTP